MFRVLLSVHLGIIGIQKCITRSWRAVVVVVKQANKHNSEAVDAVHYPGPNTLTMLSNGFINKGANTLP